jgi:hypothetical protein
MRPVSFLLTLSILAVPAHAEPLQIHGMTGYASTNSVAAFPSKT